jgi:hypothetical protein
MRSGEDQVSEQSRQTSRSAQQEVGECGEWKAWHDRMPGKPPTLHVTGECTFPTGGYSVDLRPREPQGINPAIYMLDRIVTEPTGPVPDVITPVPVHYLERTDARYTHVQIFPEGELVDVQRGELKG